MHTTMTNEQIQFLIGTIVNFTRKHGVYFFDDANRIVQMTLSLKECGVYRREFFKNFYEIRIDLRSKDDPKWNSTMQWNPYAFIEVTMLDERRSHTITDELVQLIKRDARFTWPER